MKALPTVSEAWKCASLRPLLFLEERRFECILVLSIIRQPRFYSGVLSVVSSSEALLLDTAEIVEKAAKVFQCALPKSNCINSLFFKEFAVIAPSSSMHSRCGSRT